MVILLRFISTDHVAGLVHYLIHPFESVDLMISSQNMQWSDSLYIPLTALMYAHIYTYTHISLQHWKVLFQISALHW